MVNAVDWLKMRMLHNWLAKIGGLVLVAILCLVGISSPLLADTGSWVDGDMPQLTVGQQVSSPSDPDNCFPTTFTYFTYDTKPNSLGHDAIAPVCALQNGLGFFGRSDSSGDNYDFIRPNTTHAFRVLVGSNATAITPIPNQAGFMRKIVNPNFWGAAYSLHFYTDFASNGTFGKFFYGSGIVPYDLAYDLENGGFVLKDSVGGTIYVRAYAFSQNGRWLVAEASGLGIIRIDTQTYAMQLIDPIQLSYGLGFTPAMTLAISDDGNSVIKSGRSAGDTTVYDLSGCHSAPLTVGADNTTAMQGCRSRDVQANVSSQLANFDYMLNMHFSADGKSISAFASRPHSPSGTDYFKVTYSVAGYQAPHVGYLALGDSFSSGEGVGSYESGTDSADPFNKCHLSVQSYPYLTSQALGITDFRSVACSGATTLNYYDKPQGNQVAGSSLGKWLPGVEPQRNYLTDAGNSSTITISMIGNDVGFKDKLTTCLAGPDDCFHFREDREMIANEFYGKLDDLVSLYTDIKQAAGNPNVKIYVLGYPQILGNQSCQANVPFSLEERQLAQGMIGYLNAVIKAATLKAGVQYIDVEHAFDGYRLCDAHTSDPFNLSSAAVNGLIRGNDALGLIGNGSFHPNALGHQLMSQALIGQSKGFTHDMPVANSSITAPYVGSDAYNDLLGDAPSANLPGAILYTSPTTLVTRTVLNLAETVVESSPVTVKEETHYLKPNSTFQVSFHSDPVAAGTLSTDAAGHLNGSITVPARLQPGYHTVHVVGKDIAGSDVDMYQVVYVAASLDDYNGNGVPNDQDPCLIIPASGVDSDHDGIDDACDGDIAPLVDIVPPAVTGSADRVSDHNGWYNHDVSIRWQASDPEPSSGAPTQPDAITADREGDITYTSGQSCDPAGNCAAGDLEIRLDTTAPTITFTVDPVSNENGWNKSAATVHFACNDELSGVESCTSPIEVSGNDGSYVITGTAVDNAGNESSVNAIVNIDTSAPTVMGYASSEPNAQGWYNQDVTVTANCGDNLSGIAYCSPATVVQNEGANQQVAMSAIDMAGNTASATTSVDIDKTAPTVNSVTWSNNPKPTLGIATLFINTTDNLSGVTAAEYFIGETDPGAGHGVQMQQYNNTFSATFGSDLPTGVYPTSIRVKDTAGNWSAITQDSLVIYNPFGVRMTGKKTLVPSLTAGDNLPGLISPSQTDIAKFAFTVGYDKHGTALANDLQFTYETGTRCTKPTKAENCHSLELDATSVNWFVTSGVNNSIGSFSGSGMLSVDGVSQQVSYTVTGLDGEQLNGQSADHLILRIFPAGANQLSAIPLYQVSEDVVRGNIKIKT